MQTFDESLMQKARLIPVTGIKGALDQERRAASALLAVMKIVPELTQSLLQDTNAPKGVIETYIEPEFKFDKRKIRPDGLIVISRGKKQWRALVEFKTGKNDLDLAQLNSYLDLCRDYKLDALITISNQVLNASGSHPTEGIDQRKLRSTELKHLSWLKIITDCIVLAEHVGVEDTERELVLKEMIRFLQADSSGASEFNDMGPAWTTVLGLVKTHALKKPDDDVLNVVTRFESLVRYASLTLSARLGVNAKEVVPRVAKSDYQKHLNTQGLRLLQHDELFGSISIPGASAELEMTADVSSGTLHCGFRLAAPQEGRNKSRISWLTRQLKSAPSGTTVSWTYKRARSAERTFSLVDLLDKSFEFEIDNTKEISHFSVEVLSKMGTKRGPGKGGFIDSVVDLFELTYGSVLQNIRPWQAPSPRLSESVTELIPDPKPSPY